VRVASGLYDAVSVSGQRVLVNGHDVGPAKGLRITGGNTVRLNKQYLTQCEYGACTTPGTWLVVPQAQVYGEVKRG